MLSLGNADLLFLGTLLLLPTFVRRRGETRGNQICKTVGCFALEKRVCPESLDILNVGDQCIDIGLNDTNMSTRKGDGNLYINTGSSKSALEDCVVPSSIAGNISPSTKILCTPTTISSFSLGLLTWSKPCNSIINQYQLS